VRFWPSIFGLTCTIALAALLSGQLAATAATGTASAQDKASPVPKSDPAKNDSKREGKAKRPANSRPAPARSAGAKLGVTPERQAAVMTFVQRNHPELADLLAHLKVRQPEEYETAVRELFRTTERLAQIQERDPLQYELEVHLWTAQSRVQLLTAKLMMGATEELKADLRTAIGEQIDARVELLKHQRQKTADRLANLDREINKVEDGRDAVIEKQLQVLTRAASEGRPAGIVPKTSASKNTNKPAKLKAASE
jgi:hypothetical protein